MTPNPLEWLTRPHTTLRLRLVWDLGYGASLVLGVAVALAASRWVGIATIAVGVWTAVADLRLRRAGP